MNSILIFACVLFSCVTIRGFELQRFADLLNISQDELNECAQNNHINNVDLARIPQLLGSMDPDSNEETLLYNFGCFIGCVFEKGQIIQDNKIQANAVQEFIEENNVPISSESMENLNGCIIKANKKSDKCETAFDFTMCIYEQLFR